MHNIFPWHEQAWTRLVGLAERLPHALLVHGSPGIGKLALAERFAQFLLCEARTPSGQPCGRCEACRWFLAGNHPDLRRVEPEALARPAAADSDPPRSPRGAKPSNEVKVEQVRELADFLNIGSHRGRLRVALVHPAEAMNVHAANALLKGLEEPPSGAVFVLVSHRPARLLPTIRSRCVALAMPVPPTEVALDWLSARGVEDARRWLAFAGGAPLSALELGAGERGKAIGAIFQALASGDREALAGTVETREGLELLAEVLQKLALDRAFSAAGVEGRYQTPQGSARGSEARAWLAYARAMGRNRALARHPLNPRLFAAEMLAAMPKA